MNDTSVRHSVKNEDGSSLSGFEGAVPRAREFFRSLDKWYRVIQVEWVMSNGNSRAQVIVRPEHNP